MNTKFSTFDEATVLHIDLHSVCSDDPIAYAYGFFRAYTQHEEDKGIDVAAAYTAGFEHGRAVLGGDEAMPIWSHHQHT
jgi:hypothetical protein